jgi:STE24 endopeptidase
MSLMTAMRMVAAATLVAAWALAAAYLWRTTVPELSPPQLDAATLFPPALLERNARYDEGRALLGALGVAAQLAALVLLAARQPRLPGPWPARGALGGALVYATAWLADLPFDLAGHWWRRRYDVSDLDYLRFVTGTWSTTLGELVLAAAAGVVVVAAGRLLGRRAWLGLWAAFVALAAAYVLVYPHVLGPRLRPLANPALAAQIQELAREAGVGRTTVEVRKARERTRAVNAEAIGGGPTTRVILWDTLLAPGVGRDEIRFAVAHELAHVARDHVWKGLGWFALLALPCLWVLGRAVPLADPRSLPAAAAILLLLQLATLPAANAVTRRYEREADWEGLRLTQDPAGAEALYRRFARTGLSDPEPPLLLHLLLDSHPTLTERIGTARDAR